MRNDICVIRADIITARTEKMPSQAILSYYNEAITYHQKFYTADYHDRLLQNGSL